MAKHVFRTGDLVQLIGGGPKMTVSRDSTSKYQGDDEPHTYRCKWFVGAQLKEADFVAGELQRFVEPAKPKK